MAEKKATVPFSGTKEQEEALMKVIHELKDEKGALMPILQKAQDIYGYLPIEVQKIIAEQTGGDLFEIEPATPYTDDYNTLLDIAQQEQAEDARPELAARVENWDSYDVIFVGYPNWWSDAPMAVYTFLESYDWNGKTLIPFNTSSSGGFGRSLSGVEESTSGATVLEGLDLTEGELSDAQSRITEWLSSLGLNG